jgi:SAM-dependent methyltransferase
VTEYWRKRHATWSAGPEDWAEHYWQSVNAPHRAMLLWMLQRAEPFASLAELGCNAGPNLRLIAQRWPDVQLLGIDVNAYALDAARRFANREGWGHRAGFECHDLVDACRTLSGWDVIVSCYALTYLSPEQIGAVVTAVVRAARRAVMFLEPMIHVDAALDREGWATPEVTEWRHDYAALAEAAGRPIRRLSVVPISPPVDSLNGCCLVEV